MNSEDAQEHRKQKRAQRGANRLKAIQRDLIMQLKVWVYRFCMAAMKYSPRRVQRMTPLPVCTMAANHYKPKQQFKGKVVLFKSKEKTPGAAKDPRYSPDPLNGWGTWATEGVKVYESDGDFHGILQEPFVQEMVEQLQNWINHVSPGDR
jgi:thioesterase domain-containing protein